jgi:imidazolonepropionase-like amidohydrolase
MKKIITLLLILLLPGLLIAQTSPIPAARALAFTNVTVIDVTGAPSKSGMTVIVTGNRIAAIGKTGKVPVPRDAQIIDGTGKFLIPGLWDMHVHALNKPNSETFLPLLVANGVTGIRDMATHTPLEEVNKWKKEIDAGARTGPRIFAAGLILDGPKPLSPTLSIAIKDETDARNAVRRLKEQGADFIKVYSRLPRDAFYAIADEAKKQGLSFSGHLPTSVTACEASEAGQRTLEHILGWLESCSTKEARIEQGENPTPSGSTQTPGPVLGFLKQVDDAASFDDKKANELTKIFSKNDTWLTPTISARESATYIDEKISGDDPRLKYILLDMRERWKGSNTFSRATPEQLAKLKGGFPSILKAVNRMHRAGAKFLAGTDTIVPYIFPGFSLHDELELFVKAGLTPLEALQAATLNPAKFFGRANEFGTIEKGKLADFVLLDANPLTDISNTKKINAVVANGRFFERKTLDKMLTDVEAAANKK